MLVLSRKVGERIVLSGGVVVTVAALRGSRVCLGFEAPPDVLVMREEAVGADRRPAEAAARPRVGKGDKHENVA
jgi:carbon storage regulator